MKHSRGSDCVKKARAFNQSRSDEIIYTHQNQEFYNQRTSKRESLTEQNRKHRALYLQAVDDLITKYNKVVADLIKKTKKLSASTNPELEGEFKICSEKLNLVLGKKQTIFTRASNTLSEQTSQLLLLQYQELKEKQPECQDLHLMFKTIYLFRAHIIKIYSLLAEVKANPKAGIQNFYANLSISQPEFENFSPKGIYYIPYETEHLSAELTEYLFKLSQHKPMTNREFKTAFDKVYDIQNGIEQN